MRGRRLWIALGGLLVLPLVLLTMLNLFVNITLPLLLNTRPHRVRIDYSYAWTVIPGTVHVRGLRIRSQGDRDQWQLDARRAYGVIDLQGLREARFTATGVTAEGVSFRYRFRVDPGHTARDTTPPIKGFDNPPDPLPEDLYKRGTPWIVDLTDATLGIRELWIEDYRYLGEGELTGSLHLGGAETHASAALTLDAGDLSRGTEPMASALSGSIGVSIAGLPRETGIGRSGFGYVSGSAKLGADVQSLQFLHSYLDRAPWLLIDGAGRLETDLALDAGAFRQGSWLSATTRDLSVQVLSYDVRGDGVVRLEITDDPEVPLSRMSVEFGAFTIAAAGELPLVEGTGFSLDATSPDRALDQPFTSLDVVMVLPESAIADIGRYAAFLPTDIGLTLNGGTGTVRGELRASSADNVAEGDVWLTGDDVRARLDDLAITLDLALHAKLSEGRLAEGTYDFSGTRLELRNVGMVDQAPAEKRDREHDETRSWWAIVDIPSGEMQVGKPITLDATIALQCADTVPFVRVLTQRKEVANWIQGLLSISDIRGGGRVKIGADHLRVDGFEIRGGSYEVLMRWFRQSRINHGSVFARYGKLSVGIAIEGTEQEIHLFNARDWYMSLPTEAKEPDKAERKALRKEEAAEADEAPVTRREARELKRNTQPERQKMGTPPRRAP